MCGRVRRPSTTYGSGAAIESALHHGLVLVPETSRAYVHLLRLAVTNDGHALHVGEPTGAGVPLRMADVIS